MEKCYICRKPLAVSHPAYPCLCLECGEENLKNRDATIDLYGHIALVTGGRIKIGYHTALRLLRCGAQVIVTSRFPYSALSQYRSEADYDDWADRLHIYGLDLLRIDLLEAFVEEVYRSFGSLDILVNNAAQTVKNEEGIRRQTAIEDGLSRKRLAGEGRVQSLLPQASEDGSQMLVGGSIVLNSDGQNAWVKKSGDVDVRDLLETQIINVTAPYLLSTALRPLMAESTEKNRFLINVSSLEGKFGIKTKSSAHPHTNMAKAALNMMTKTFADEFRRSRIYVYSIDPGWVSNQFPDDGRVKRDLPLDFLDAAARITYPIFTWKDSEKPPTGIFLKDYVQTEW